MGASSPGDGEDDPSGSRFSDGAKRSARGAAGGDPVINDDDRPARKRRRRLVAEIKPSGAARSHLIAARFRL
jgi:hypothetical protein